MPPKLKRLSGKEVIAILTKFGFAVISQRGSHVKLRRNPTLLEKQTLTIPNHKEIDAARYTPLSDKRAGISMKKN